MIAVVSAEILKREIKAFAFDQYGTIVDMQQGLTEAVTPFLKKKGWTGEPHRFVTWWRRTHFENSMIDALCDRGHTPYREIGQRAVSYVMNRCGIAYTQDDVRWLVSEIEKLKPFPDAVQALERLKSRYKLAILSNGDRDMLEAAKPHIGFPFDHVISVQEAGYFKPHWKTYAKAETGASGPSARPRTSPILLWRIFPNWLTSSLKRTYAGRSACDTVFLSQCNSVPLKHDDHDKVASNHDGKR